MAVTSSRQWDVFGWAPHIWVRGPNLAFVQPPPAAQVSTIQAVPDTAPFVHARGLPYLAPLFGPSASPMVVSSGQKDIFSSPAFVYFRGTPSITTPPQGISTGAKVFTSQHADASATFGQLGPFTWTITTSPQVTPIPPARGFGVFTINNDLREFKSPEVWVRATVGLPTISVLSSPAFRASFQRAGGHWDILSDAAFFFAAGYALQNPGPPPMVAISALQPDSAAPFSYTRNTLVLPPNLPVSVTDFAFGIQQSADTAPYVQARGTVPAPTPMPPFGASIFAPQLSADVAAFKFVSGLYTTLAFTPAFVPPRGANASGVQQSADYAAYSFVKSGVGLLVPTSTVSQTDYAFPPQQPADSAAYAFTRSLALQFSAVPPLGSSITTRALEADTAPWSWVRAVFKLTPIHIAGSVFAKLHDDAIAPFIWTRDRAIKPFIPTPIPGRIFIPAEKDSTSGSPIVFAKNSIILPNPNRPTQSVTLAFAQDHPDYLRAPYVFLQPALQWETVPFVGGLLVQQAIYNLVNAGLEVFIQYAYDPVIQYGYVISQVPPAGTVLPPWTVVTITASEGLPPAPGIIPSIVPDLTGMVVYLADKAIFDASLSIGQYTWVVNSATAGTVVSQTPPPGAQVAPGTIVTLTLSMGPIPPPKQVVTPQ